MATASTEFRVFIPTMFRNMHAERDAIAQRVIPELTHHCTRQRLKLIARDGRWGIVEAQTKGRDVVATCLDAIALERPIVLGILANHSDPTHDNDAPKKARQWLTASDDDDRTIELDLIESLLDNPLTADRTFFYIGEGAASPPDSGTVMDGHHARLHHLQHRIRRSRLPVRYYTTPEMLATVMLQDLLNEIERRCGDNREIPALTQERRAHAVFAASRRTGYVPIGDYIQRLDRCVEAGTDQMRNVAIVGPPGVGKSALAAYWAGRISNRSDIILIEHYVGHSLLGNDLNAVLQHILHELREECDIADPVPTDLEGMALALRTWPAYAQSRTVVVVIDALNRLEMESRHVDWLTKVEFPSNVRLVVTTLTATETEIGSVYAELSRESWNFVELTPLTLEQRWKVVEHFLDRESKPLSEAQLRKLSANTIATTPLFLRTIIEEFNAEASFAETNRQIYQYLSARTLQDLFTMILQRLEEREEFGAQLVQDVASFIWASRHGLSANELFDLVWHSAPRMSGQRRQQRRVVLDKLLDRLGSYLICHEERYRFFHDQLSAAVEQRYLPTDGNKNRRHVRLAGYFGGRTVTSRTASEAPYQWMMARKESLAACVIDIDMVFALSTEEHKLDLLRYWRTIKATDSIADQYLQALVKSQSAESLPTAHIIELLHRLGTMFNQATLFHASVRVLKHALEHSADGPAAYATRLLLSDTYQQLGQFGDAEDLLRHILNADDPDVAGDRIVTLDALNSLGRLYYAENKYEAARESLERALPISMEIFGSNDTRTLATLSLMGAVSLAMGNHFASEHLFRSVLKACRHLYNQPHPDTSAALSNVAAALRAQSSLGGPKGSPKRNRLKEALMLVQEALDIDESVFGEHHSETAFKLINLGSLLRLDNQPDRAEHCYDRALGILVNVYGEVHLEIANCRNNRGTLYANSGRFNLAAQEFISALEIRRAKLGPDNVRTIDTELNLAWLAYKSGDPCMAVCLYKMLLPRKRKVSGDDHPETIRSIAVYEKALAECKELRGTNGAGCIGGRNL